MPHGLVPHRLRVMTYNVRSFKDDRAAAVEVVRSQTPDVLALQEPPRGPLRHWLLRRFAAQVGLRVVVSGHGARTTALLVSPRCAVTGAQPLRLSWRVGTTRRGASLAVVDGVRVVCVHLGLRSAERAAHLEHVLRAVAVGADPAGAAAVRVESDGAVPVVLLGDLNELPGGHVWTRLGQVLTDAAPGGAPTYDAVRPRKRIDAVFVSAGVLVERAHVPDDATVRRGSDHRPVVADLVLQGSGV